MGTAEQTRQVGYSFTDRKGRVWDVTMTLAGAKRIDSMDYSGYLETEFSILRPDRQTFYQLMSNAPFMFTVIWALVRPQAITMYRRFGDSTHSAVADDVVAGATGANRLFPVDPDADEETAQMEFAEAIDGAALEKGRQAFWGALSDFFPDHKTVLLMLMNQHMKAIKKADGKLQELEVEMERMVDRELEMGMDDLRKRLATPGENRGMPSIKS